MYEWVQADFRFTFLGVSGVTMRFTFGKFRRWNSIWGQNWTRVRPQHLFIRSREFEWTNAKDFELFHYWHLAEYVRVFSYLFLTEFLIHFDWTCIIEILSFNFKNVRWSIFPFGKDTQICIVVHFIASWQLSASESKVCVETLRLLIVGAVRLNA